MNEYQTTLGATFDIEGVGVHTGVAARVRVHPASADAGLVLETGGVRVPLTCEQIVDTRRATTVAAHGARVSTVEHLLSALFGMGIDNARVEVEGPEVPIVDGSAAAFVEAIIAVGTVEQDRPRRYLTLAEPLVVRDGDALIVALPAVQFSVRIAVDHGEPIGAHTFSAVVDPATYAREIAGARTYCALADAQALLEAGLARGGSLENALVFGAAGPLTPLRWAGEPARHKALDLIGDLALVGARPRAEFVAFRSGHGIHAQLAGALRECLLKATPLHSSGAA